MTARPKSPSLTAVRRAAHNADMAAAARDIAIRKAHSEGHTLRAIAEFAGISHGRVFQIVNHTR